MFITSHGQRFEIRYLANVSLLQPLLDRLTQPSEDPSPAGQGSSQPSDRTALTVTVRLAEVA